MKTCLTAIDIMESAHSTASGEAAMPGSQEGLLLPVDLEMLELRGKINTGSLSQRQYKLVYTMRAVNFYSHLQSYPIVLTVLKITIQNK